MHVWKYGKCNMNIKILEFPENVLGFMWGKGTVLFNLEPSKKTKNE
jgi:hypothetical protein